MSINLICDSCNKPIKTDDYFSCTDCVNGLEKKIRELEDEIDILKEEIKCLEGQSKSIT